MLRETNIKSSQIKSMNEMIVNTREYLFRDKNKFGLTKDYPDIGLDLVERDTYYWCELIPSNDFHTRHKYVLQAVRYGGIAGPNYQEIEFIITWEHQIVNEDTIVYINSSNPKGYYLLIDKIAVLFEKDPTAYDYGIRPRLFIHFHFKNNNYIDDSTGSHVIGYTHTLFLQRSHNNWLRLNDLKMIGSTLPYTPGKDIINIVDIPPAHTNNSNGGVTNNWKVLVDKYNNYDKSDIQLPAEWSEILVVNYANDRATPDRNIFGTCTFPKHLLEEGNYIYIYDSDSGQAYDNLIYKYDKSKNALVCTHNNFTSWVNMYYR